MKIIVKFLLMNILLNLLASCGSDSVPHYTENSNIQPTPLNTIQIQPTVAPLAKITESPILIDPDTYFSVSQVLIIAMNYQTLRPYGMFFHRFNSCDQQHWGVSDNELRRKATALFYATTDYFTTVESQLNNFERVGDFVLQQIPAGDFGGFTVSHPCNGLVLYAGTTIFDGTGKRIYPGESSAMDTREHSGAILIPPSSFDVRIGIGADDFNQSSKKAWDVVKNLDIVQQIAKDGQYSILLYLYPRSIGVFNPEVADWIIFIHRGTRQNQYYWNNENNALVSPLPTPVP